MTDPLDEAIQRRFYPGSTTPIPDPSAPEPPRRKPEPGAWDDRPQVYTVNGVEVEFFTIGALGQAMGKSPVTLREWERRGFLPKARFRTASTDSLRAKRLYTRQQIEGIVLIAEQEGLLRPKPRDIAQTGFTDRVVRLFQTLEGS